MGEYNLNDFQPEIEKRKDFFILPTGLIKDPRFKGISLQSLLLYSILKELVKLSKQNSWIDNNKYFVRLTRKKAAAYLGITQRSIKKYFDELVEFGLIKEKKTNRGSTKIFVKIAHVDPDEKYIFDENCDARNNLPYYAGEPTLDTNFIQLPTCFVRSNIKPFKLKELMLFCFLYDKFTVAVKNNNVLVDDNDYMYTHYKIKDLSHDTGLDDKSVKKYINKLEQHELLISKKGIEGYKFYLKDIDDIISYINKINCYPQENDCKSIRNTNTRKNFLSGKGKTSYRNTEKLLIETRKNFLSGNGETSLSSTENVLANNTSNNNTSFSKILLHTYKIGGKIFGEEGFFIKDLELAFIKQADFKLVMSMFTSERDSDYANDIQKAKAKDKIYFTKYILNILVNPFVVDLETIDISKDEKISIDEIRFVYSNVNRKNVLYAAEFLAERREKISNYTSYIRKLLYRSIKNSIQDDPPSYFDL